MIRRFNHIAQAVRLGRLAHPKQYSQSELSHLLGYKNGQFVSNIERAKCSVPVNRLADVAHHLGLEIGPLKEAMMKDFSETIDAAYEKRKKQLEGVA